MQKATPSSSSSGQTKFDGRALPGDDVLHRKVRSYLSAYLSSTAISSLEGEAQRNQIDKDVQKLDAAQNVIYDIYENWHELPAVKEWIEVIDREKRQLLDLKAQNLREVLEVATIKKPISALPGFSKLPKPQLNAPVLAQDFIVAIIDGRTYHLFAGQNFLNVNYSTKLWSEAPAKEGAIEIYVAPDQTGEFLVGVIGDAHHRFIWRAHHGLPLTAELIPRGYPQKALKWSEVIYQNNPKHVFRFDKDDPRLIKLFNAAVSPLWQYRGMYDADPLEFAIYVVKSLMNIPEVIFENDDDVKLLNYLHDLISKADPKSYHVKVMELKEAAKDRGHADAMAHILVESFGTNQAPIVALGPTPSVGYYSADYHVIILDPVKNPTPDGQLDTLAYESGNALRRHQFLNDKKATTAIEFDTTQGYIDMLMEATHSGGINQLVVALDINPKYCVPANADTVLTMSEPLLAMPTKEELPSQKMRSALAWWKMHEWTDEQRKQYFSRSAHAEGMKATGEGYKSQVEQGPSMVSTSNGKKVAWFSQLIERMVHAYPLANSSDFAALLPRHYGEFMLTGRILKWYGAKPVDEPAEQHDLIQLFLEDLNKAYPRFEQYHLDDLTYTDFGEFVLTGEIKGWEPETVA